MLCKLLYALIWLILCFRVLYCLYGVLNALITFLNALYVYFGLCGVYRLYTAMVFMNIKGIPVSSADGYYYIIMLKLAFIFAFFFCILVLFCTPLFPFVAFVSLPNGKPLSVLQLYISGCAKQGSRATCYCFRVEHFRRNFDPLFCF